MHISGTKTEALCAPTALLQTYESEKKNVQGHCKKLMSLMSVDAFKQCSHEGPHKHQNNCFHILTVTEYFCTIHFRNSIIFTLPVERNFIF